ncbi:hypothetical protein GCM10007860_22810 [Chitiniphilus shinanonensis]|uniref:Acylphosphatase n=1 Tax=Chitiniphilus shinanonensis TaxID=553088 RepID=A0ABQ6BUV9_9NEIS|nr:acylphosphatase [Chitiniphilus shinanonensis]GLS05131.1 hypothetical protein GCM10007860_22810 [Chitiniphilus shinanonensis]
MGRFVANTLSEPLRLFLAATFSRGPRKLPWADTGPDRYPETMPATSGQAGHTLHDGAPREPFRSVCDGETEMIARKLRIRGRVQGVGFRYSAWLEAKRLDVAGWVRNRDDGSVELFLQGDAAAVAKVEDWAHRGPNAAYVESVEGEDCALEDCAGFQERSTV